VSLRRGRYRDWRPCQRELTRWCRFGDSLQCRTYGSQSESISFITSLLMGSHLQAHLGSAGSRWQRPTDQRWRSTTERLRDCSRCGYSRLYIWRTASNLSWVAVICGIRGVQVWVFFSMTSRTWSSELRVSYCNDSLMCVEDVVSGQLGGYGDLEGPRRDQWYSILRSTLRHLYL
jgi:hypothetical protein